MKKLSAALVVAALLVALPGIASAAPRAHGRSQHKGPPPAKHLVITKASAMPHQFSAKGGRATVTASVRGATKCWVTALGSHYAVKVSLPKPARCSNGTYKQVLTFSPNMTKSSVVVKLRLSVAGANGKIASRALYVLVAGEHASPSLPPARLVPPTVLKVSATPAQAGPDGGLVVAAGSVRAATSCRLVVLGDKGIKVTLPKPVPCSDGLYGQPVKFGLNASKTPVTVKLALIATGAKGMSARGVFYVVVAGHTQAVALPPGMLPLGVTVKVAKASGAPGRLHAVTAPTSTLAFFVHMAHQAQTGPQYRLAFGDMEGQSLVTVSAPSSCAHYVLEFSRPVPATTVLLVGLEQRWGKNTWVPDGARIFFSLARSPIAFTVLGHTSSSTPGVLGKGATSC